LIADQQGVCGPTARVEDAEHVVVAGDVRIHRAGGGEGRDRDTATNAVAGSAAHGLVGGVARVVDAGGAAGDIATAQAVAAVAARPAAAALGQIAAERAGADRDGRRIRQTEEDAVADRDPSAQAIAAVGARPAAQSSTAASLIAGAGAVADGRGRAEQDLDAPPTQAPGAPLPPAPPMAELPVLVPLVTIAVMPELMSRPPPMASLPAPPPLPAPPMTWLPTRLLLVRVNGPPPPKMPPQSLVVKKEAGAPGAMAPPTTRLSLKVEFVTDRVEKPVLMAPPSAPPMVVTPSAPAPPRAWLPAKAELRTVRTDPDVCIAPPATIAPEPVPSAWLPLNVLLVIVAGPDARSMAPPSALKKAEPMAPLLLKTRWVTRIDPRSSRCRCPRQTGHDRPER
jgi:hypothetical protein